MSDTWQPGDGFGWLVDEAARWARYQAKHLRAGLHGLTMLTGEEYERGFKTAGVAMTDAATFGGSRWLANQFGASSWLSAQSEPGYNESRAFTWTAMAAASAAAGGEYMLSRLNWAYGSVPANTYAATDAALNVTVEQGLEGAALRSTLAHEGSHWLLLRPLPEATRTALMALARRNALVNFALEVPAEFVGSGNLARTIQYGLGLPRVAAGIARWSPYQFGTGLMGLMGADRGLDALHRWLDEPWTLPSLDAAPGADPAGERPPSPQLGLGLAGGASSRMGFGSPTWPGASAAPAVPMDTVRDLFRNRLGAASWSASASAFVIDGVTVMLRDGDTTAMLDGHLLFLREAPEIRRDEMSLTRSAADQIEAALKSAVEARSIRSYFGWRIHSASATPSQSTFEIDGVRVELTDGNSVGRAGQRYVDLGEPARRVNDLMTLGADGCRRLERAIEDAKRQAEPVRLWPPPSVEPPRTSGYLKPLPPIGQPVF